MKIVALLVALLILSALAFALLGTGGRQWGQVAVRRFIELNRRDGK